MSNAWEAAARQSKALALADVATGMGLSSEKVAALNDYQRSLLTNIANVRKPSVETWALVIETLRKREAIGRVA